MKPEMTSTSSETVQEDRLRRQPYDSVLIVSFGGPEGPDDVMPFLENVLAGKPVPDHRKAAVAEHYYQFGGVSPINGQVRDLISCVEKDFSNNGVDLPIYWGNRNWHPMLGDTLKQMQADGCKKVLAFVTSAFSSFSGCRQYRNDIALAQEAVGAQDIEIDKLRVFYNDRLFIEAAAEQVVGKISEIDVADGDKTVRLMFTAHSIPQTMAAGSDYVEQLNEASQLVFEKAKTLTDVPLSEWELVYQSRSGRPTQPWLEPDVCDRISELAGEYGQTTTTTTTTTAAFEPEVKEEIVIVPIGFLSDHMEVIFDLDTEAKQLMGELKLDYYRAKTVGTHPKFVSLIRNLIAERTDGHAPDLLGTLLPKPNTCAVDCCLNV